MFFLGAGILILTNSFFIFFGTDQEQPWNSHPESVSQEAVTGRVNHTMEIPDQDTHGNREAAASYFNQALSDDDYDEFKGVRLWQRYFEKLPQII